MTARVIYLLILFSCLSFVTLYGQAGIKALNLSNVDTSQLYIGVPNHLKVTGVSRDQVELHAKFCSIQRINKNEFNVRAYYIGKDTITVSQKGAVIFTKVFEVNRIPDPKICVAKYYTNDATIEEILSDPALYFVIPNCPYLHNISVWGFSGLFIKQNGDIIQAFSSQTNRFANDQVKIIASLRKGDKIFFDKVMYNGTDSMPRTFQSFTLTIK